MRLNAEKITFLKSLNAFKLVNHTKLRAVSDHFKQINKIKDSYLFQEGDPVTNVYIVISGEFTVSKKILRKANENNT